MYILQQKAIQAKTSPKKIKTNTKFLLINAKINEDNSHQEF